METPTGKTFITNDEVTEILELFEMKDNEELSNRERFLILRTIVVDKGFDPSVADFIDFKYCLLNNSRSNSNLKCIEA
jgi:hypothetical protein